MHVAPAFSSPMSSTSIPTSGKISTDTVDAYFLAEISMRRMLHRCNTAIRRTPQGTTVYAPRIASELARQLDEWHTYLPESIQFSPTDYQSSSESCLTNFLYVQYHCYRISTYWPAAYQALQDHSVDEQLLQHCQKLLESYEAVVPSLISALGNCIVNRWTLFAT